MSVLAFNVEAQYQELQKTVSEIDKLQNKLRSFDASKPTSEVRQLEAELQSLRAKQRIIIEESARMGASIAESVKAGTNGAIGAISDLQSYVSGSPLTLAVNVVGLGALSSIINNVAGIRGQFQLMQSNIDTLLGSAEKGKKLMGELNEYAKVSPLDFKGSVGAAQMMLGFGIEAKKVVPFMKALGDVSMGNSQRFNSLTLAFSQMSAAGKLMGQDLNQMINAGFNPLQTMAEKTGKSIGQLKEEMSKGAITAEMVQQAFLDATTGEGKYAGMADKATATISGQMSMLEDATTLMFNDIGEKSEGAIMKIIEWATALVENWDKAAIAIVGFGMAIGSVKLQKMIEGKAAMIEMDNATKKLAETRREFASDSMKYDEQIQKALDRKIITEQEAAEWQSALNELKDKGADGKTLEELKKESDERIKATEAIRKETEELRKRNEELQNGPKKELKLDDDLQKSVEGKGVSRIDAEALQMERNKAAEIAAKEAKETEERIERERIEREKRTERMSIEADGKSLAREKEAIDQQLKATREKGTAMSENLILADEEYQKAQANLAVAKERAEIARKQREEAKQKVDDLMGASVVSQESDFQNSTDTNGNIIQSAKSKQLGDESDTAQKEHLIAISEDLTAQSELEAAQIAANAAEQKVLSAQEEVTAVAKERVSLMTKRNAIEEEQSANAAKLSTHEADNLAEAESKVTESIEKQTDELKKRNNELRNTPDNSSSPETETRPVTSDDTVDLTQGGTGETLPDLSVYDAAIESSQQEIDLYDRLNREARDAVDIAQERVDKSKEQLDLFDQLREAQSRSDNEGNANGAEDEVDSIKEKIGALTEVEAQEEATAAAEALATAQTELDTTKTGLNNAIKNQQVLVQEKVAVSQKAAAASRKADTIATEQNTKAENANALANTKGAVAVGAGTAAIKQDSIATQIWTGLKTGATTATLVFKNAMDQVRTSLKAFGASLIASPIGPFIALLTVGTEIWSYFSSQEEEATGETAKLGEETVKTRNDVQQMYSMLQATDENSKLHKESMKDLVAVCNEYGFHLDAEKVTTEELIGLKDQLIARLEEEGRQKILNAQIEETLKKKDESNKEHTEKINDSLEGNEKEIDKYGDSIAAVIQSSIATNIEKIKSLDQQYGNAILHGNKDLQIQLKAQLDELMFGAADAYIEDMKKSGLISDVSIDKNQARRANYALLNDYYTIDKEVKALNNVKVASEQRAAANAPTGQTYEEMDQKAQSDYLKEVFKKANEVASTNATPKTDPKGIKDTAKETDNLAKNAEKSGKKNATPKTDTKGIKNAQKQVDNLGNKAKETAKTDATPKTDTKDLEKAKNAAKDVKKNAEEASKQTVAPKADASQLLGLNNPIDSFLKSVGLTNGTTVAPEADGSNVAGLGVTADTTKGKLEDAHNTPVNPEVNKEGVEGLGSATDTTTSSLQTADSQKVDPTVNQKQMNELNTTTGEVKTKEDAINNTTVNAKVNYSAWDRFLIRINSIITSINKLLGTEIPLVTVSDVPSGGSKSGGSSSGGGKASGGGKPAGGATPAPSTTPAKTGANNNKTQEDAKNKKEAEKNKAKDNSKTTKKDDKTQKNEPKKGDKNASKDNKNNKDNKGKDNKSTDKNKKSEPQKKKEPPKGSTKKPVDMSQKEAKDESDRILDTHLNQSKKKGRTTAQIKEDQTKAAEAIKLAKENSVPGSPTYKKAQEIEKNNNEALNPDKKKSGKGKGKGKGGGKKDDPAQRSYNLAQKKEQEERQLEKDNQKNEQLRRENTAKMIKDAGEREIALEEHRYKTQQENLEMAIKDEVEALKKRDRDLWKLGGKDRKDQDWEKNGKTKREADYEKEAKERKGYDAQMESFDIDHKEKMKKLREGILKDKWDYAKRYGTVEEKMAAAHEEANKRLEEANSEWERKSILADLEENTVKKEAAAQRELLKQYGTYLEKRKALEEEYGEKMTHAETLGEQEMIARERQAAITQLDIDNSSAIKKMDQLGLSLQEMSKKGLDGMRSELEHMLQTMTLTKEQFAELTKRLNDVTDASRRLEWGGLKDMLFGRLRDQVDPNWRKREDFKNQRKNAEENLKNNEEKKSNAETLRADALKRKEDAEKRLADAQSRKAVAERLNQDTPDSEVNDEITLSTDATKLVGSMAVNAASEADADITNATRDLAIATGDLSSADGTIASTTTAIKDANEEIENADTGESELGGPNPLAIIGTVNAKMQSLPELLDKWGLGDSGFGKAMGDFAESSQYATAAFDAMKNGDFVGMISNLDSALGSLGNFLGRLGVGGMGYSDLTLHDDMEKLARSNEALQQAIEMLSDDLTDARTVDALDVYEEQKKFLTESMNETQSIMKRAGASHNKGFLGIGGSGSSNKKIDNNVSASQWMRVSNIVGRAVRGAGDFFSLTSEQMASVAKKAPDVWAEIKHYAEMGTDDAAQYMDQFIEYYQQFEELQDAYREKVTSTNFDSVASEFKSLINDMESTADDFTKSFESMLRTAVTNSLIDNYLKDDLEKWYADFANYIGDDNGMTKSEQDDLKRRYDDMAATALHLRESVSDTLDWENSLSQQVYTRSLQGMTQDTAESIEGRMTAMHIAIEAIRNQDIQSGESILSIEKNQMRQLEMQSSANSILAGIESQVAKSYLELMTISENTGAIVAPIKAMQLDIADIKLKTREL